MPRPETNNYTFGDSDRALERLYWLAQTFDPSTLAFVAEAAPRERRLVIDLGAGPGFLSRSLHRALSPEQTVGLELSERFVEFGRRELPRGVDLLQHDVTTPLPLAGDLLVCRFLLTHLRDPGAALRAWNASAAPGATVLIEETAQMASDIPLLENYYELVARVQRAAGQEMTIGRRIAALVEDAGLRVERAEVQVLPLPVGEMARLHAMNLPTLRAHDAVQRNYTERELDGMQAMLEGLAREGEGAVRVSMARCQAVCR